MIPSKIQKSNVERCRGRISDFEFWHQLSIDTQQNSKIDCCRGRSLDFEFWY